MAEPSAPARPSGTTLQEAFNALDAETISHLDDMCKATTDLLWTVCNEPSVGLYYVQDNIRSCVPRLVELRRAMAREGRRMEDAAYGAEYCLSAVTSLRGLDAFDAATSHALRATQVASDIAAERAAVAHARSVGQLQAMVVPTTPLRPAAAESALGHWDEAPEAEEERAEALQQSPPFDSVPAGMLVPKSFD
eukprot:m51a1_g2432 hypothetical protein (193) ;mRNA; r:844703-845342